MKTQAPVNPEMKFDRSAWLTLLAAGLFIALNLAQVAYRFTLPSLGWVGPDPDDESFEEVVFLLDTNAVGAPSALQPGDLVVAIGEVPTETILKDFPASLNRPAGWQIGETITLTVERDGLTLNVDAPLVRWTPAAWISVNLRNIQKVWLWLTTLLLFGVGVFTFLKRPGSLAGRFLLAFGLAGLSSTLSGSVPDPMAYYLDLPAGYAKVFFSNIIFAYLLAPSFLGFALTFPQPKGFIRRQPRWLLLPYLVGSSTILLLFTAPQQAVIGFLFTFLMLLLGVISLIHAGFTQRDAISRAQLRWAVGGVVAGVALFMLNFATYQVEHRDFILAVASLGFPIVSFSLAIAILRYRLFDIDILIRRTLVYTILTATLALVYFGLVILLDGMLRSLVGSSGQVATVISTLGIAALFTPLRRRVQDLIDRRFYRQKYNAEQALAQFAATAKEETDLEALSAQVVNIVQNTMQPDQINLWLTPQHKER
ncbi:MAG TPA: hypothetical protein VLA49_13550 [Anaerolineales bacterium]|nr:hypothetical protein [Anaerolineales bacterium]